MSATINVPTLRWVERFSLWNLPLLSIYCIYNIWLNVAIETARVLFSTCLYIFLVLTNMLALWLLVCFGRGWGKKSFGWVFHRPTSQSSAVSVATDWCFKLWEARAGFLCQPQLRSCGRLRVKAPVCQKVWTIILICKIHCLLPQSMTAGF